MAFSQTDFEALTSRMEVAAQADARGYRRRVLRWALFGYGYLGFVVALLVALTIGAAVSIVTLKALGVKLVLIVGTLLYTVGRAMFVRLRTPEGRPITPQEAPQFFALLDGLKLKLGTVPVHEVLLTTEFNAGVLQVPKFGLIGWHHNVLLVGLPLLQSLSLAQFEAVLAHEMGHLSRGHGRFGNKIYRLRLIWSRLLEVMHEDGPWGSAIVRRFLKWYIPRFSAVSFPLARLNEYEADRASVQATSPRIAAQALTGVHLFSAYISEKYWPSIHATARRDAAPTVAPYAGFVADSVQEVPPAERAQWQTVALSYSTTFDDTHPSLRDRLAAIGAEPEFAPPARGDEAATLLGPLRAAIEQEFDEQWRRDVESSWTEFHKGLLAQAARREALHAERLERTLVTEEILELADLEERLGAGAEAAVPLLREVLQTAADPRGPRYELAKLLLRAGNEEGVAMMQTAMEAMPVIRLEAAGLLARFSAGRGRADEVDRWRTVERQEALTHGEAAAERDRLRDADEFIGHELDADAFRQLEQQVRAIGGVRTAWLVRKALVHFPDQPLYVLGITMTPWWRLQSVKRTSEKVEELAQGVSFPGSALVISLERPNTGFRRKFKRIGNSRLI